MYDADVTVMPRRADGCAMSWVGGWGSRKDLETRWAGKETGGETKRNFSCALRACVRMRMLSIYLFNQFSTLIVVLSFGPSVKSTLGRPQKRSGFPAVRSTRSPRPLRAALPPRCVRAQPGETCCGAFRRELKWLRTRTSVRPSVRPPCGPCS